MKKKTLKRLSVLCLAMLMVVGASAWLFDNTTQQGTNDITVGTVGIEFTNQDDTITLTANSAIPMTQAYAVANLTPYEFKIHNDGDVALDYQVKVDNFTSTFTANKVMISDVAISGTKANSSLAAETAAVEDLVLFTGTLAAGESTDLLQFYAYLDETLELAGYTGNSASFRLIVNANQTQPAATGTWAQLGLGQVLSTEEYISWDASEGVLDEKMEAAGMSAYEYLPTVSISVDGTDYHMVEIAPRGSCEWGVDGWTPTAGEHSFSVVVDGITYSTTVTIN